jgi:acetyl esterase/lipase
MSLRAELSRLLLRSLFRSIGKEEPDLAKLRRTNRRLTHWWVRNPPRSTRTVPVDAGGIPAVRVTTPLSRADHNILYLHGGAYIQGSPSLYRDLTWRIADAARAAVLAPDYRLAPEHPFPAAVEDAVGAYRWLVASGADARKLAIMGDSAGGGLVFAMLMRLRDEGDVLPAAAVALSPWADLTLTSDTVRRFAKSDPVLNADEAHHFARWYLGGADPRHPYASPVFGDPRGLPPALIQVGDDEILLGDAETMAMRLREAGCTADLEIWPRMPHVWHMLAGIVPESHQAVERIAGFLQRHWTGPP